VTPHRRRVARNLVANVAVQALNKLFPIIVYAYAQRKLGTEGLGHALFALALVDWTTPLVEAGTGSYGQIAVGREHDQPERMERLLGEIITIRGINALIALIGLVLVLAGPYADYREIALAISFMTVATAIDMSYVQTGTQRIWALSALNAGSKILVFLLLFVVVRGKEDVTEFAMLLAAGNALFCMGTFSAGVRRWRPRLPSRSALTSTYRAILPFAVAVGLCYSLEKFDYMLVEAQSTPVEIGLYGGISRIFISIQALLPALGLAFGAEMLGARDPETFTRQVERSLGFLALLVAPITVGVWFVAKPLLSLLYDPSYTSAATSFSLLCMSCVPYAFFFAIGLQALTTRGAVHRVNGAMAVGLVVGVAIGLVLVPRLGMLGAAIAVLGAKLAAVLTILPSTPAMIAPRRLVAVTAPSFAAAFLMGFTLWAIGSTDLWLTIIIGTVVYVPATALFNSRWLGPIVRRRRRG